MAYEHIQEEIRTQGKTQNEMARIIGRTHAVASNIFKGTRPIKIDEVTKLATWLRKTPTFILYGKDEIPQTLSLEEMTRRLVALESTMKGIEGSLKKIVVEVANRTDYHKPKASKHQPKKV